MECQREKNLKVCPCTYPACPRKGFCCQCLAHHRKSGEVPACYFSAAAEKSYDRSVINFIKDFQAK